MCFNKSMKAAKSAKLLLIRLMQHKQLLIISGVILFVALAGATAYARYHRTNTGKATVSSSHLVPAKEKLVPTETTAQETTKTQPPTPAPAPNAAAPQQAAVTPTIPAKPSTAERRASLPTPAVPTFSTGHLTGGVVCYTGVYAYSIGSIAINLTNSTTAFPGFYWQVELNNGTILEKGGAHIPSGSMTLPDFPSTPNMPSSFKSVYNPPDGLSARFVITSPTYTASNWTSPVPVGSGTSCYASPDYIPR
jgi:hypothetical protein